MFQVKDIDPHGVTIQLSVEEARRLALACYHAGGATSLVSGDVIPSCDEHPVIGDYYVALGGLLDAAAFGVLMFDYAGKDAKDSSLRLSEFRSGKLQENLFDL